VRRDLTKGITREEYMRDIEPTLTRPLSLGGQQERPPSQAAGAGAKQLKDVEVRPKKPPKDR
jgi:hypothetical protein